MMRAMISPGEESELSDVQILVDSIPALIHTARPDGYLDYFNKPWLEYLGVTLDKVTGWNWTTYVHPKDVEGIVAKWRDCLATGEIFEYETRVRKSTGEYRWMFHRKVPLLDADGNIVKWFGSSLDIEERKTAEEQLRHNAEELQRSEFYLAEGQRLSHTGSWAWNVRTGALFWSEEIFRIYGYTPQEHSAVLERFVDRLGLQHLTLMVHDWGGPIGLGFAGRRPDLVHRLIIGNTFAWSLDGAEDHRSLHQLRRLRAGLSEQGDCAGRKHL